MKFSIATLTILGTLAAPLTSVADTYQIEANADLARASFDFDRGGDADVNRLGLGVRYFLAPVKIVGPWGESAFLQKSSSAGVELSRISGDVTKNETDFTVDAHYVTLADFIVGGELSSDDDSDISLFGGRYLDHRSSAIVRISLGDNVDSIGAEYKNIIQLANGHNFVAEAGLALLDAADTGFEIDTTATYYPSDQVGVAGILSYDDLSEEFTLGAGAEIFASEAIAARGLLSFGFGDTRDTTNLALGIVGRF